MIKVLITGATSGIGEATARKLAGAKYHLILCGRNEKKLNQLKTQLSTNTVISVDVN